MVHLWELKMWEDTSLIPLDTCSIWPTYNVKETLFLFFHLPNKLEVNVPSSKLEVNVPLENPTSVGSGGQSIASLRKKWLRPQILLHIRALVSQYHFYWHVLGFCFFKSWVGQHRKVKKETPRTKQIVHLWGKIGFLSKNKSCSSNYYFPFPMKRQPHARKLLTRQGSIFMKLNTLHWVACHC